MDFLRKTVMNKTDKITNNTLAVITGLVISIFWIFLGLDFGFHFKALDDVCFILTLGGFRYTIMSIVALILIPICARENKWGFLGAIILGIVTVTLSMTHVIYMVVFTPSGYQSQLFGPLIWSIIHLVIIFFSYRAYQELYNQ